MTRCYVCTWSYCLMNMMCCYIPTILHSLTEICNTILPYCYIAWLTGTWCHTLLPHCDIAWLTGTWCHTLLPHCDIAWLTGTWCHTLLPHCDIAWLSGTWCHTLLPHCDIAWLTGTWCHTLLPHCDIAWLTGTWCHTLLPHCDIAWLSGTWCHTLLPHCDIAWLTGTWCHTLLPHCDIAWLTGIGCWWVFSIKYKVASLDYTWRCGLDHLFIYLAFDCLLQIQQMHGFDKWSSVCVLALETENSLKFEGWALMKKSFWKTWEFFGFSLCLSLCDGFASIWSLAHVSGRTW